MTTPYLLGIDIGTSGCKVGLFTVDGELRCQASQAYETHYPEPGGVEQNPDDWWNAASTLIRRIIRETGIAPREIKAVGVDGQSGALVPVDQRGRPLIRAMTWLDRRTARQCEALIGQIGFETLFSVSGNPVTPTYVTGKILWLKERKPEVYKETRMILQSNGYMVYRLTGRPSLDVSQGNGIHAFDIAACRWDEALAERIGIDPRVLPPIHECHEVVGEVTARAAEETGLAPGTPVVAGGLDAACATLGAGALHPGEVQEQGGQAGGMSIVMDWPIKNERLILSRHVVPGRWILQGGTVGGGSLNWLKRTFAGNEPDFFNAVEEEASRVKAGSDGLVFLPYMSGERSPIWDPDARGVFVGLDYSKTRGHIVRAIMEGCALALQHNLKTAEQSGVSIRTLHCVGGAANSRLWTQIKADVTGKLMKVPSSDSATTLGAAILAGLGIGLYRDAEEAVRRAVRIRREHRPDEANHALYRKIYGIYIETYERLKDMFPRMGW